ncbi:gamma-glutamyl-gamma-aminobutyrate hydrolase family protein [Rhodocaloribacter sp.]
MEVRIGITTSYEDGEQRLHHTYVQAVERAGGLPVIVPMLDAGTEAFADLLDGLIITGGPAVTDRLIGALPPDIDETDPVRARADRCLLAAFVKARKPVLGICYGMQLLNAAGGGSIFADVERQVNGASVHSSTRGADVHPVHLVEGSHLRDALGVDTLTVNTRHIQAVAEVGEGFSVAATSPDGVIEAIESADGLMIGVQFHPERMGEAMQPLFRRLVDQARIRRRNPEEK